MPRRGENVYKRKDGRWEGRVLESGGKYKYVYAKTYKEVKARQRNYEDYSKELNKQKSNTSKNTAELFQSWMVCSLSKRVKPSTYESYYWCTTKYIIPFFSRPGNECLSKLTVTQFVNAIRENPALSVSYQRKIVTIFKLAIKEILADSPNQLDLLQNIKSTGAAGTPIQAYSVIEQQQIEKTALSSDDSRALGIVLCFYTGIRLGELCALKWSDIDFEAGTLSISKTVSRIKTFNPEKQKTALIVGTPKSQKSVRKIPLPAFLLRQLNQLESGTRERNNFIFSHNTIPADPRSYQRFYKQLVLKAGVEYRKFHVIRHSFATRALEIGIDIKTLSEILGHSNVSITLNVYAHSLLEQKKIAIDKLNDMHKKLMLMDSIAVINPVTRT